MTETICGRVLNSAGMPYSPASKIEHEKTCARCGDILRWQALVESLRTLHEMARRPFAFVERVTEQTYMEDLDSRNAIDDLAKLVEGMKDER